ncbi:hypothetical protein RD792_007555 [Penstemon davidsonii]|uniref:Aldehyde dehydrogenase domain-containing protein n=1 Tax=Penstemon davidsonii TaxID=160366 RepID=A0ABR0D6Q8_9LAMI|nr:hypothetical protein RD792_007555 [Penstemon davidsonii]
MSTDAKSVADRLSSSGFIRSQGFIGGKWTDAYDEKTIEVCNPATGEVITNVSCMGGKETNDAIESAHNAFVCLTLSPPAANGFVMEEPPYCLETFELADSLDCMKMEVCDWD